MITRRMHRQVRRLRNDIITRGGLLRLTHLRYLQTRRPRRLRLAVLPLLHLTRRDILLLVRRPVLYGMFP